MRKEAFQPFFEECPVAAVTVDRAGRIRSCNREATSALQRRRDELVDTPLLACVAPEDREQTKSCFLEVFRDRPQAWRVSIRRGDGLTRRVEIRARALPGGAEEETAYAFLVPTGAEEPLRPELVRLAPLLQNLPGQFVAILDAEARIRFSVGLARTHWHADADWLGQEFVLLLDATPENEHAFGALRAHVESGASWAGVLWHGRADGARFPVETFALPSRDPRTGAVIGALVAGRDASAEHDARDAAAAAERLAGIGRFVTELARTLEEPVRRAAAALRRADGGADAAAEVERIERLVGGLLGFATDVAARPEPLSCGAALAEVAARWRERMARVPVELSLDIPAELPAVYVDAAALDHVLDELFGNAWEAVLGRPGARIHVEATEQAGSVAIRVRDNGSGLPSDAARRIFEPFFSTREGRLGLGLAAARRVVEAAGGRLWAERVALGGTTLALELPLEPATRELPFRPVPLEMPRERSVLVVDEDASSREVLRRVLARVGYRVSEAWSGRSALARITAAEPLHLVLADLRVGDGTGFWLLNRLRADFPEVLRRTVVMTGDPSLASVDQATRETGCPVVRKPLDFKVLLEVMDEAVARAGG
ncbi:MAG TPA: ATP-binding protein [Longimicrobiales bacterium]|nr:ATP-binding protein [Longimicrobiales bacterium]